MELSEMPTRAAELEQQISALPAGSITKKNVNGKEYFYHRWTENKKRREKYIPVDELESFRAQIERRKELEQELKALKKQLPKAKSANLSAFTTNDPPDFRGDEQHGACQDCVHSDHRKRHAARREPRPQGIGSAGLSLCVPR